MGSDRVGPAAKREYLGRMRERYAGADRATKQRLLDEVCVMTGYHRKAVIRALRRPPRRVRRPIRSERPKSPRADSLHSFHQGTAPGSGIAPHGRHFRQTWH